MSINKVILIGRIGKDAEIKNFEKGNSLIKFSLATSENYKTKDGEWKENTEWHNIIFWTQNAESYATRFVKGVMLYLEGKIQTRSWDDQNGNKKYMTEISVQYQKVIQRVETNNEPKRQNEQARQPEKATAKTTEHQPFSESDDDLPF